MKNFAMAVAVFYLGFCYRASGQGGIITTVAGNSPGFNHGSFSGDGGPATSASLNWPTGLAVDATGSLFIADFENNRIRRVSANGTITTVAGSGPTGHTNGSFSGDGGPATSATLAGPVDVAVDSVGNIFIADTYNSRIRKVSPNGIITTVAGNGKLAFSGDGGPASSASLFYPEGVAVDASGNLFIADDYNQRIRKVSLAGVITTVAGSGVQGFSGDGGPATSAAFYFPTDVVVDPSGNLFIVDAFNDRVRKVSASGIITTVAGNGTNVPCGSGSCSTDGGPAASASVVPLAIALDSSGNLYIADLENERIRRVSPGGVITTVAGTGNGGFSGDGGPATSAFLSYPDGVALDASGNLFIADNYNERVRRVSAPLMTAPIKASITPGGVVPLYSTVSTIQPGEWVSIYGVNLASSTLTWNGDFPASLGGTSVTINGKAAYLSFVSPTQINLQAPDDTATGPVPVVVTTADGTATSTVTLGRFAPSFLLFDDKHAAGIISRSDGSGAYGGGTYDVLGPTGNSLGYPTMAAKTGETVALFAVGLGPTNPAVAAGQPFSGAAPVTNPVNLLIGNSSVTPSFAGLSGTGLDQINFTVPPGLGTGDLSLVGTVGGSRTQSGIVISLQAGPVSAPPQLQSLTLSPNSVASGGMVTGSVVLSVPAPPGGAIVALSSSSSAASVPATVTVPAGATSATFTVSAASVSSSQTVTITASYGGKSVQATLSVVATTGSNGSCQAVTQGPYTFQVVNTLSSDILVYFGDVILPSGQHGSVSFGAQMHPNECDIIGLPQIASYSVAVNRYPSGTVVNNTLTFTDTTSGFIFNGRSAYTLRVTQGTCSASADQGITFNGKSVYSLCLP